jgi:hypothetical protein
MPGLVFCGKFKKKMMRVEIGVKKNAFFSLDWTD